MEHVKVMIRCADDDCPLNRRYEGFILVGKKKMKFNADSIVAIKDQLVANGYDPTFEALAEGDRAIVEAKHAGCKVVM